MRVAGRSDGHGSRLRPRPAPRPPRQDRWTAAARRPPSASAIAAKVSSARTRGSRFSSCRQCIGVWAHWRMRCHNSRIMPGDAIPGDIGAWQHGRLRLLRELGQQLLQGLFCLLLRKLLLFDWRGRRKLLGRQRHPHVYRALPGGGPHHKLILTAVLLNSEYKRDNPAPPKTNPLITDRSTIGQGQAPTERWIPEYGR